jgi:CRP-like cAMP-binding protein
MFRNKKTASTEAGSALANVSFFEGFSPKELDRVAELAESCDAEPGAMLTEQGRPGQECYVILEGTAGVYIGNERMAELGAGEMVGEMALIDHRPRSATVKADSAMRLLKFDSKRFRTLLDEMPKASQKIMTELNERLRNQNLHQ